MQLYPIEAGNFKLDGGAMFGVVPKSIWQKTNPADSNNMIDIGARSLLIEDGNRLILIDTGLGDKQSEKFFQIVSFFPLLKMYHLLKILRIFALLVKILKKMISLAFSLMIENLE